MAYLLNYKKWEKLYESKKLGRYGSLYEQAEQNPAFIKGQNVTAIVLSGTSKTPIIESTLSQKYGLTAAQGKGNSIYEISLDAALKQEFGKATFISAIKSGDPVDQFTLLDSGGAVLFEKKGFDQKITFTVNSDTRSNLKIRFAGNGVLCMHRASGQTLQLPADQSYHVRMYMGFNGTPVPNLELNGTDTARFSLTVGVSTESLMGESRLISYILGGIIGYVAAEQKDKQNIIAYLDGGVATKPYAKMFNNGDFSDLKQYPVPILKPDSKTPVFVKQDELATNISRISDAKDSLSNSDFNKMRNAYATGTGSNGEKDLEPEKIQTALLAIHAYVAVALAGITKDGGLIDSYYDQELKGIEIDILSDLKQTTKAATRDAVNILKNKFKASSKNEKLDTFNGIKIEKIMSNTEICEYIQKYVFSKNTDIPTKSVSGAGEATKVASTYTEGESGKNTQTTGKTVSGKR